MVSEEEVNKLLEAMTDTFAQAMANLEVPSEIASAIFMEFARIIEEEMFNRVIAESYDNQSS